MSMRESGFKHLITTYLCTERERKRERERGRGRGKGGVFDWRLWWRWWLARVVNGMPYDVDCFWLERERDREGKVRNV